MYFSLSTLTINPPFYSNFDIYTLWMPFFFYWFLMFYRQKKWQMNQINWQWSISSLQRRLSSPFARCLQTAPLPPLLFSNIDLFHLQEETQKIHRININWKKNWLCGLDFSFFFSNRNMLKRRFQIRHWKNKHSVEQQQLLTNTVWRLMKYANRRKVH